MNKQKKRPQLASCSCIARAVVVNQ